jgi:signal peptidase
MRPAIDPGDLLIIRQQDAYQPGDIITFTEGGSLVTHRLLALEGQTALTRGDANNSDDAPVELSRVQGKMVLRVPALGRLLLFLRTNQGMLSLTALLVLLVAVPLIIRGGHDDRSREKEEKDKPYEA